jgi:hypothetical protein
MRILKFVIGFLVIATAALFVLQFRAISDKVAGWLKINADRFAYIVNVSYSIAGGLLLVALGIPLMGMPVIGGLLISTGVARVGFTVYKMFRPGVGVSMTVSKVA